MIAEDGILMNITWGEYKKIVEHLKQIITPSGAWNNDDVIFRENIIQSCVDHAEKIMEILNDDNSLSQSIIEDEHDE